MEVRFKKLHPNAKLPTYSHEGDAGLDLYACETVWLSHSPQLVNTGLAVEIPVGFEGQVRPRSSINLAGVITGFGTIDSGYRGELCVVMTDTAARSFRIQAGERIAQLVIKPCPRIEPVEATELHESERGARGWGSSGR